MTNSAENSSNPTTCLKVIPSNGDCFYQAVVEAFMMNGDDVRKYDKVGAMDGDEGALALRRTAAMAVTEEMFENFKMYNEAGLQDFEFMSSMDTLDDVRDLIVVSGLEVGSKKCLWANEFEIRAVCEALDICCLILDMDTKDPSSKYLKVGLAREKFIILHRSGEHYSLVFKSGEERKGVVGMKELTRGARANWKIE